MKIIYKNVVLSFSLLILSLSGLASSTFQIENQTSHLIFCAVSVEGEKDYFSLRINILPGKKQKYDVKINYNFLKCSKNIDDLEGHDPNMELERANRCFTHKWILTMENEKVKITCDIPPPAHNQDEELPPPYKPAEEKNE